MVLAMRRLHIADGHFTFSGVPFGDDGCFAPQSPYR